jgi:uncharacterized protein YegP (UPF0339 family)
MTDNKSKTTAEGKKFAEDLLSKLSPTEQQVLALQGDPEARLSFYVGKDGDWRWKLQRWGNWENMASGEGFKNRPDAIYSAEFVTNARIPDESYVRLSAGEPVRTLNRNFEVVVRDADD